MLVEVGKFTFPVDVVILKMEEDSKVPLILGRPFLHTANAVSHVKQEQLNLGVGTERMTFFIDSEDFDALLDEGSKILYSIKGTLLKDKIFSKFDEFMAMNIKENSEYEFDKEEIPFKKITFDTEYKIKKSLDEPATDLEIHSLKNPLFFNKRQKDTENVATDHLSRIENDETSDNDDEIDDNFPSETLMEISTREIPWFAGFANYLVGDIMPKGMTYQQKNKFFSDLKNYFWEDPYLFKVCSDGMIRRCVSGPETHTILDQCHHGPTGRHYGPTITAKRSLRLRLILTNYHQRSSYSRSPLRSMSEN
ncbi:reverse transcriptase domain-containing protein [Tanacetum coccineum]|uniref:Reverse transcriptase domain-containing protein n=1 Tax=Tanacetum coccineum TaxID=301880 RepID=A0ABQ5IL61_9ASTR